MELTGRAGAGRVLLIDDVATHGSTLKQAIRRLNEVEGAIRIIAATAGQMIVKASVTDDADFIE